jgi:hypothetical protein
MPVEEEKKSEDSLCPICQEIIFIPRIYPCGHSTCEECMIKSDKSATDSTVSHRLPVFKCSLCRHETYDRWFDRPINHTLLELQCQNEAYAKKFQKYKEEKPKYEEELNIPSTINLSYICQSIRYKKFRNIYKKLLPILLNEAMMGKPLITITSRELVKEIYLVADLLSRKLINSHGIYRFIATPRECEIEFVSRENAIFRVGETNDNVNLIDPILEETEDLDSQEQELLDGTMREGDVVRSVGNAANSERTSEDENREIIRTLFENWRRRQDLDILQLETFDNLRD